MKEKSFNNQLCALKKSGKLEGAACHELSGNMVKLRHDIRIGNRKDALKHFGALCDALLAILDR